ncbi:PQQ-like beta-propeller repeat protein [Candidatus Woesearchaeota archaeon]|nr:PQQ-like beta-propeller repeat protein [Candidatus Woesearchaeota archaeon]
MANLTFGFKKRSGRLDRVWEFDAESNISSSPLVADIDGDGKKEIVFGTKKGKLFVLDMNAGIKWFYDTYEQVDNVEVMFLDTETASSIEGPPNHGDIDGNGKDEIVFGTEMGVLYCLSDKGMLLWKKKFEGTIRGQPVIYDLLHDKKPKVIVGCGDKKLRVLDSKGKDVWFFDAESEIESTPGTFQKDGNSFIVFGCNNGMIYCLNNKGDKVWSYKTGAKILAQPAFSDLYGDGRTCVVIGSSDNYLYVLDDAGELLWKYKTEGAVIAKASIDDITGDKRKEVVFGSCDNKVYCLNRDGDKVWSYETDFWIGSEPILEDLDGDGKKEVIIGSYDHNIYVLDAEGSYVLDFVPGLGGIVGQTGSYSDVMTKEPGKTAGKKIWQFKTNGVIVGCAFLPESKSIVVNTKPGKIDNIKHKE